jgi:hypothetical protein
MILKLTTIGTDELPRPLLIDTFGIYCYPVEDGRVCVKGFYVKETIAEIEQQIKEGGICGTN